MGKKLFIVWMALGLVLSGCCGAIRTGGQTVQGSGRVTSETRDLGEFSSILLESSANMDIAVGEPGAVVIEAEDNILPLIQTQVKNDRLVISTRPNTSMTTTRPIHIRVAMAQLDGIRLSGSGNIQAVGVNGNKLDIDMPGSGNITASGTVEQVEIKVDGSGEIHCGDLQAQTATVRMPGSGSIWVYAGESLDVKLGGSGSVHYRGNPAHVNKDISGSGSITPE